MTTGGKVLRAGEAGKAGKTDGRPPAAAGRKKSAARSGPRDAQEPAAGFAPASSDLRGRCLAVIEPHRQVGRAAGRKSPGARSRRTRIRTLFGGFGGRVLSQE